MKAMVLAAGLGTRLRPITYEMPKPLVPVLDRPIMSHILELVNRHGFTELVANLSYLPDQVREEFGDGSAYDVSLDWSFEEELLGTAGGVRKVRGFFGQETFLVMAADALTDIDLGALAAAHERNDGIATLAVRRVPDTSEYGVVVTGSDGRIQGFQEKPDPAEALSDLANCMIYMLEPEIFDYFPDEAEVDFALNVFPSLLEGDVPFYVHETDAYWNDIGTLDELRQGNFDALAGAVSVAPGPRDGLPDDAAVEGEVFVGAGAEIGAAARLDGPLVVGAGSRVGEGARLKESVLLPGTELGPGTMLMQAIAAPRSTG